MGTIMETNKTKVVRGRGKPPLHVPKPYIEFGYTPSNLRYLGHSLNLNATEIAEIMGVHPRSVYRWWADDGNMKASEWQELLLRVGVDKSQRCDTLDKCLRIIVMGKH